MYLLFYSKRCKYSEKFIELLYEIGEEKFFKFVEVLKSTDVMVKKYKVKEVPTIIVDSRMYVGKDAFKWLEGKIKNLNHQVSSVNSRANKTPVISGYSADLSSAPIGGDSLQGTSMFSPLGHSQKIDTPDAETEYEKTPFILPNDNITNGDTQQDDRPDKVSRIDTQLENLLAERNRDIKVQRQF